MNRFVTFLLLSAVILSCNRSIDTQRAGNNFFYTNAAPSTNEVIQGVRMTCDVVQFRGNDKKSLSITMYTDNGYFIQTGYHTSFGSTIPFTQVWLNGQQVGVGVTFIANPPLNFGGRQSFSIYNVLGTTKWRTTRGGIDCLEIELFSQQGDRATLYTEIGPVLTPSKFPKINFYPAIETYVNGNWQSHSSGIVTSSTWGIEGQVQNSLLQANELNIGTGIQVIPSGTILWNTLN